MTGPRRQKGPCRAATPQAPRLICALGADETPAEWTSWSRSGTQGDSLRVRMGHAGKSAIMNRDLLYSSTTTSIIRLLFLPSAYPSFGRPLRRGCARVHDLMPSNHNRDDKPWDTEDIDKWKVSSPRLSQRPLAVPVTHLCVQIDTFTPTDNLAGAFAEESSFGNGSTVICFLVRLR